MHMLQQCFIEKLSENFTVVHMHWIYLLAKDHLIISNIYATLVTQKKGKTPCQAVCNKLVIDEVPSELESLRKLESVLRAQRIVFQKIIIMPKGQQRKIKGAICNIPVDYETVCRSLPRPSE